MKVLLIAEAANPEWVSVPLVGWSMALALREQIDVHIVTHARNRAAFLRAGMRETLDFTPIDSDALALPMWKLGNWIRRGQGKGWTVMQAVSTLSYYYFEWKLWRSFGARVKNGEFSLVHRITPLSPTAPSIVATRCRDAGVPFILGPLNGGLPWPPGFEGVRSQEHDWLSRFRRAYRFLPGYRSTLNAATVILGGSRFTLSEIPDRFKEKCIYIPENGIDPLRFPKPDKIFHPTSTIKVCFVGRLVPYKGPDIVLSALEDLLRQGVIMLEIIGSGPMDCELANWVQNRGLNSVVTMHGHIGHESIKYILSKCKILCFPSIREFGGAVVIEAMAMGVVPIVADYGGPAELVNSDCAVKLVLSDRSRLIEDLKTAVTKLVKHPAELLKLSLNGINRAHNLYSWSAKANYLKKIYWSAVNRVPPPPSPY